MTLHLIKRELVQTELVKLSHRMELLHEAFSLTLQLTEEKRLVDRLLWVK